MNKREFDDLFDKAFDEAAKEQSFVPDSEESWKRVERRLEKKRTRKARLKLLPYIAASFVLGALIFGTPTATEAFNPFIKAVASITDDVVSIVFGAGGKKDTKALTPPPPGVSETGGGGTPEVSPGQEEMIRRTFDTWEEAAEFISFPVPDFSGISDDYDLNNIVIITKPGTAEITNIHLSYTDNSSNVRVIIQPLYVDSQLFSLTKKDKTQYNHMNISGTDIYYFNDETGSTSYEFVYNDQLFVSIIGTIGHEEMTDWARNIIQ